MRFVRSNILIYVLLWGSLCELRAQVLSSGVQVSIPPELSSAVDRALIQEMERNISQLLDQTTWTSNSFLPHQRLRCELNLSITSIPSINQYEATAQWILIRPVYGSSYETVLMNYTDTEWNFEYVRGQPLRYTESAAVNEITGLLAFYVYLFLAMDADSFASQGGTPYLQKAQQIMTLVPSTGQGGWSQFGNLRNRYWILDNLLDPQFLNLREISYQYHIHGLDRMATEPEEARKHLLLQLRALRDVFKRASLSVLSIMWLDSKYRELISVFSKGTSSERKEAYELLKSIDPTRTESYRQILSNK